MQVIVTERDFSLELVDRFVPETLVFSPKLWTSKMLTGAKSRYSRT